MLGAGMSMQEAVDFIKAKAKGVRQMPELDLTKGSDEPPEPRPGYDEAVAHAGDVPDDVVQPVGEPVIKAPQVAAGEASGPLGAVAKSTMGAQKVTRMPEDPAERMKPDAPQGLGALVQTPGPADSSGALDEAIQATRRNRGLATIGEAISARTNRPRNLLDFAIQRAGVHPEPMPQDPFVGQAKAAAEQPMADFAQQYKLTQDAIARRRQAVIDQQNAAKSAAETKNLIAQAGKADREPMAKPEKPAEFSAADYKAAMKASPGIVDSIKRKLGLKTPDEVSKYIDGLPDTKDALELVGGKDLENEAQGQRAEARGININLEGAKTGLGKEEAVKQSDERTKINTARKQLNAVQDAFHQVSGLDLAKSKVGWDSPEMSEFRSSALALIDKMAQVETGATGRQSQVDQWKHIIEGNSVVTNKQIDAIARGLRGALDSAQEENEARTQGLPQLRKAPPPPSKPVTVRDTKTGKQKVLDAATAAEVLKDPEFEAIP